MTNSEIRKWAKEKIKKNFGLVLVAIILEGLIMGTGFGWALYFVEVGLAYFMVKFITDQAAEITDIFSFSKDFVRDLVVGLVQSIFIALWSLLFVIPGIIKSFAYALVPYLLADSKYQEQGTMDILNKSEEMMNGHKMDYFMLHLGFIGWHILSIFTLGLLELWIIPYERTAATKFLYDVKTDYEKAHGQKPMDTTTKTGKFCSQCGAQASNEDEFCPNCGSKM